jgi:hypothetical protein
MVGGGFTGNGTPLTTWTLDASYPSGTNAWTVNFHTSNQNASTQGVLATAVCVRFAKPIQTVIVSGNAAPLDPGTILPEASCPLGYTLLSGGYYYDDQSTLGPASSYPSSPTTWQVATGSDPNPGAGSRGQAFALCGQGPIGDATIASNTASQEGPYFLAYQASCSTGDIATGGGFKGGSTTFIYSAPSKDSNYNEWGISVGQGVTVYAVCTSFQLGG